MHVEDVCVKPARRQPRSRAQLCLARFAGRSLKLAGTNVAALELTGKILSNLIEGYSHIAYLSPHAQGSRANRAASQCRSA
jgi:hypothetical protein